MTSRSAMDLPATVMTALLGVALIAVSLPFLLASEEGGREYGIAWTEGLHGSSQANVGAQGATTTVSVPVTGAQVASARIEFPSCTDGFTAPVQSPATLTWRLFEGTSTTVIEDGTATCAQATAVTVQLDAHADIASTSAASADAAQAKAYGAGENQTTSYRLEFSWNRPAAVGGLPLPAPAFSASMKLTVNEWLATANEIEEATR